jgi:NTE family protein
MIADEADLASLSAQSKLDTGWPFLQRLRDWGRAAADRWLAAHRADVGVRSSVDVGRDFLGLG